MPDELVTIAKFHSLGEAKVAQGKLNSAGIAARVRDENAINLHIGMALGGIGLQVPDSQVVRALEVLDDFSLQTTETEGEDEAETDTVACCPECESLEIREIKGSGPRQIALWSAAIPFPEAQQGELLRRWRCLACGYQWETAEE